MENRKNAEVRLDDGRNFKVSDELILEEFDPAAGEAGLYSGASIRKRIVGITKLSKVIPDIDPRWVILYLGEINDDDSNVRKTNKRGRGRVCRGVAS